MIKQSDTTGNADRLSQVSWQSDPRHLGSKSGFTLIELLVVVAIIALLISILLPSLNRAREQARMVVCGSNLRQVGVGMSYYNDEYDGIFPPHAFKSISTRVGGRGQTITDEEYTVFSEGLWLLKHVQDWKLYQCPSDPWVDDAPQIPTEEIAEKGSGSRARSYAINEQNFRPGVGLENQPPESFKGQAVAKMKYPSQTVLLNEWWRSHLSFGDVSGGAGDSYWDETGSHVQNLEIVHPTHLSKSANLLFADMHVERVDWGVQLKTKHNPQGGNQLKNFQIDNGYPELGQPIIWDYRSQAEYDKYH